MARFPGLLPWHFGGEDCLTFEEADAVIEAVTASEREQARQAAKQRAKKIPGGPSRRR